LKKTGGSATLMEVERCHQARNLALHLAANAGNIFEEYPAMGFSPKIRCTDNTQRVTPER
jgi:hypothetical protein